MSDTPAENSLMNRRQFAKSLTTGGVAASLAVAATGDATPALGQTLPRERTPQNRKPMSVTELYLDIVEQMYFDERIDKAGWLEIRRDVEQQLLRSERLADVPLTNADEPGFAFGAYRADG